MKYLKPIHSMIYFNHNGEEIIFFVSGNDLRTFHQYINYKINFQIEII